MLAQDHTLTLSIVATNSKASCPLCHTYSARLHSRYTRTLTDLPFGSLVTTLKLKARRFFCVKPSCKRRIFTERFGAAIAPYARRTQRLSQTLLELAYALVGAAGSRLAHLLAMPVSPRTLLRLLAAQPLPQLATPRVLGLDDWSWKKGERYGTLLTDLERHQPVALLSDRSAESLTNWLLAHSGVEIITRDRSGAYAEGARAGAPQALQVADRFHLGQNLRDALEKFFLNRRGGLVQALQLVEEASQPQVAAQALGTAVTNEGEEAAPLRAIPVLEGTGLGPKVGRTSQQRQARYVELYEQIHALYAKKVDVANIARQVGVSRQTVYNYLKLQSPPEPTRYAGRPRLLQPYQPYLIQRWNEGCRNAEQMWRELAAEGFKGSRSTVERFVSELRRDSGVGRSFKAVGAKTIYQLSVQKQRPLTPLAAARLFLSKEEQRSVWQTQYLEKLLEIDEAVARTYRQVAHFCQMLRERQGEQLDDWLKEVKEQGVAELSGFAKGLEKDYQAVKAGLTLSYSNGQSEGQINRLKLLKRQTYGQAGFELLSRRVLHREVTPPRKKRNKPSVKAQLAA